MKLNNLDDFTKNNWYITTPASTIVADTSQLKDPIELQQPNNLLLQLNTTTTTTAASTINNYRHQLSIEENYPKEMPATTAITTTAAPTISTTSAATTQADVLAVEELVHEIKENLRLKARPSTTHHHHHHYGGRSARPSPYHIPCRSWNDQNHQPNTNLNNSIINTTTNENHLSCNSFINKNSLHHNYHHHHHHNNKKEQDIDDPYELLQTLLKSKNLVKEAVRRLQLSSISPKQQRSYFYESDDESRSPMFRMCQLEM